MTWKELNPPAINSVVVSGRVSRRKAIVRTGAGRYLLSFELTLPLDAPGEAGESSTLVDVEVWGEKAEDLDRRLEPDMNVLIEGKLASVLFEDKTRTARHRMVVRARTVQLLDPRG